VTPEALLDLFVLAPVGLVEVDEDGRVEVANLAARTLLTPFTRAGSLDDLFVALGAVAPDLAARVRGFLFFGSGLFCWASVGSPLGLGGLVSSVFRGFGDSLLRRGRS
jgi:hypothetical protein